MDISRHAPRATECGLGVSLDAFSIVSTRVAEWMLMMRVA